MATIPDSISLTSIATDAEILSSDHRNNYAALQQFINPLQAILAGGSSGQALVSGGGTTVNWSSIGTTYRKTSPKAVNTTVSATDLLNGEITVAAGAMGTTGLARLTAFGDGVCNPGAAAPQPRFQLVFGGTTLIDTGSTSGALSNDTHRFSWEIEAVILNAGAANSQSVSFRASFATYNPNGGLTNTFTTGTGGWDEGVALSTAYVTALGFAVNTAAVNTANAQTLVLNVINGSSSASYETKLLGALVEVI